MNVETRSLLNATALCRSARCSIRQSVGALASVRLLLIRLEDRYEEIMGFFEHEGVPFDNNQAERDLRMMKPHEKISGTFRSEEHAVLFADIRSVISTARKQSRNLLVSLAGMLQAPRELGDSLVDGAKS